ncbi:hypothetical protein PAXINDRAFT_86648 [Paxillus involutus ATCC 200175]|uniref:Uncharacterized protein n=1 Tax=Paxillus involutus ATCC 200175 TaxID=664439 RepID=A0A0C9TQG5_PAXIN|nr:hypothetical protein PAXINDRAFT_86648 [Paxillus involutus ATCC 200175]
MAEYQAFTNVHTFTEPTKSVATLAFSPAGSLLASGGDDSTIYLWDLVKGVLKHRIFMSSFIVCLTWDSDTARTRLFVGCADGTLAVLDDLDTQEPSNSVLTGMKAPIFTIAVDQCTDHIVFAIGSAVHLAKPVAHKKYTTFKILPAPQELPNTPEHADRRICGWAIAVKEHGTQLIVAYLNHGIVCWNLTNMSWLWRIVPIHRHRLIPLVSLFSLAYSGHAALSPDEKTVLLSNLCNGADLYSFNGSHPHMCLKYGMASDVTKNVPLQVTFINKGEHAACGSSEGIVSIWNLCLGKCLQVLEHGGAFKFLCLYHSVLTSMQGHVVQTLAVSSTFSWMYPTDQHNFQTFNHPRFTYIATATSQTAESTRVLIWRANKKISESPYLVVMRGRCIELLGIYV